MRQKYGIEVVENKNFKSEVLQILNKLHNDAARYILLGSRQHEAIHKLRVNLKKARGIIRLLRDEIGNEAYHQLNAKYRNIVQTITELRDYTSQVELLEKMKYKVENDTLLSVVLRTIKYILLQRKQAFKHFLKEEQDQKTAQMILAVKEEIHQLNFTGQPETFILQSLRRVHERARSTQEASNLWQDEVLFHYWRKQVKYLMFQLMLLQNAWPEYYSVYINELKKLEKTLGKLHDMHLFNDMINQGYVIQVSEKDKSDMLKFITTQQEINQRKAEKIGERIFAEDSKSFAKRLYNLWIIH